VLEPDAVADLLGNLAVFGFNGKAYAEGQSFAQPGVAQFDPAVTIVDDPLGQGGEPARSGSPRRPKDQAPAAGPAPKAQGSPRRPKDQAPATGTASGLPFDVEGTPRSTLTLVRDGTTAAVTHDRRSAAEAGATSTGHASPSSRTWGPIGAHLRLVPSGSGAAGHTDRTGPIAESARPLVAAMTRGLLITDLWYTRVLDQKSLVVTGLTRNGVWLVEDGEVTGAVGNLRFTQSYPLALGPGAVHAVGATAVSLPDRWPGVRYSAPALHLASWHLTGNAGG
jgi:hypothetical protein